MSLYNRDSLNQFLIKLEEKRNIVTPVVLERVKQEYLSRLNQDTVSDFLPVSPEVSLEALIRNLFETMEEIELRLHSGEYSYSEMEKEFKKRRGVCPFNEMFKLLTSLNRYKESIGLLTSEIRISSKKREEEEEEPVDLKDVDISQVLSDFDQIDIFAEYQEGDSVYDKKYEEEDRKILNEIFFHILDGYLDPLSIGFKFIMKGNSSVKLLNALLASIRPLRRSAQAMGFTELSQAFLGLESILDDAIKSGGLIPSDRVLFMRAYGSLTEILPESGKGLGLLDILDTDNFSSSLILSLIQTGAVQGWMIQALMETGVTTPERLMKTGEHDIKAITGLPIETCREMLAVCRKAVEK